MDPTLGGQGPETSGDGNLKRAAKTAFAQCLAARLTTAGNRPRLGPMAKLIPFPRNAPPPQSLEPPVPPATRMPLTRGERIYHAGAFSFLVLLSLPLFVCLVWGAWTFVIAPMIGAQ